MIKKISPVFTLTAFTASLMLAGCGGGGSGTQSGSTQATAGTPDQNVTITGSAAKGTIKNARVKLYSIAADGSKGAAVATTVTGGDGTFTAKVSASIVLLSIEVDGGAGGTFTDEISGQDLVIPADFIIRNVAHLGTPGVTTHYSSVTPFTEMIAETAESLAGGLTPANVDAARTGFTAAFGFNAEAVKPVDVSNDTSSTASDDEKQQGLLLTAVSKLAADSKFGCTIGTPAERIGCVVKAIGKIGTVGMDGNLRLNDDLRKQVRQSLEDVVADTRLNHTGKTTMSGTATFAQSVLPTRAGGVSGIQGAKNLFASLRNNSNSVNLANKTGALNTQITGLETDFRASVAPLDRTLIQWSHLLASGIDFYNAYRSGSTTDTVQTELAKSGGGYYGSCTLFFSSSVHTPATAVSVGCSTPGIFIQSNSSATLYIRDGVTITPGTDATTYTYKTRARIDGYTRNSDGTYTTLPTTTVGSYGDLGYGTGTITYTVDATAVHLAVAGTMPARFNQLGIALDDHQQWNAVFDMKDQGNGLSEYALSGDITSIKGGVAVGTVHINPGSIAHYQESTPTHPQADVIDALIDLTATAGNSKVAGKLALGGRQTDKTGLRTDLTTASFEGSLASSAGEFFKGKLGLRVDGYGQYDPTMPDSASNFAPATATFEGAITLPNRPAITLIVNVGKPSLNSQALTAQYQDGDEVVKIAVLDTNIGVTPRQVKITTADGVEVDTVAGASTANVVKSGEIVAVVDISGGKINYKDGAFESLR